MKSTLIKLVLFVLLLAPSSTAFAANGNSVGKIDRIYHNSNNHTYIRLSTGNNTSECFNSPTFGSHRISQLDTLYEKKLSLLLFAYASNKTVHLRDVTPPGTIDYCGVDIVDVYD